jgi:hypoxanthine phosphoribosyltransferase
VSDEREILTYELFGTAARELAETIAADGFRPDAVIGIARGGLPLAGALGYALDIKMLGSLNVEFYTDRAAADPRPGLARGQEHPAGR